MNKPPAEPQPEGPFTRRDVVDEPGIIGASWWQESIATEVPRRQAMKAFVALGGALAAMATLGTCAFVATRSSQPSVSFEPRNALDMQKEYG
ncbi:MAG TPA: hypothetical protein VM580_22185, partial [Labilithrix sp.]|nr:hypothetical protein [Labilithrix sp.]